MKHIVDLEGFVGIPDGKYVPLEDVEEALKNFRKKLEESSTPLEPEISDLLNKHFWELV